MMLRSVLQGKLVVIQLSRTVRQSCKLKCDVHPLTAWHSCAGKSTLLRSTCAVALLGGCGLMVPADAARIPFYGAYILRNFSGDSPLEEKSSFAMEMDDVR